MDPGPKRGIAEGGAQSAGRCLLIRLRTSAVVTYAFDSFERSSDMSMKKKSGNGRWWLDLFYLRAPHHLAPDFILAVGQRYSYHTSYLRSTSISNHCPHARIHSVCLQM